MFNIISNVEKQKSVSDIFEEIKRDRSKLFGFFSMMPKGGDLHHHYSGSVYAESYIEYVFQKDYYINESTNEIKKDLKDVPDTLKGDWKKLSAVANKDKTKLKLLRAWSNKDFVKGEHSSDEHFFSTFVAFGVPSKEDFVNNLQVLKLRALNQKLCYIETMFISIKTSTVELSNEKELDLKFLQIQKNKNEESLFEELEIIYNSKREEIIKIAENHNKTVYDYHTESNVEDDNFTLRFQNYIARYQTPTDAFVNLFAAFHSSDTSNLITGVNIVAAENGETSMRDYWLQTMYYKFLEKKYPNVKYAIHAGELVSGMVQPESLGTHIKQSLVLNNLTRIGHAVDIIYDNEFTDTINNLKLKKIAIEINLSSNEFILGVSHDLHPIEIYLGNDIPIVISTDDEGVLRTSITEQYVLLAHRYSVEQYYESKIINYDKVKEIIFNSILYSNIKEDDVKAKLLNKLKNDFDTFESKILKFYNPISQEENSENVLKFMQTYRSK